MEDGQAGLRRRSSSGPGRAAKPTGTLGQLLTKVVVAAGALVALAVTAGAVYRFSRRVGPQTVERPEETPPAPAAGAPVVQRSAAARIPARPAAVDQRAPGGAGGMPAFRAPAPVPILEIAPPAPAPRRSVSARWYEQADGHREALEEQRRSNAPMLIYFRVDWCPYCQRMDSAVVSHSGVVRALSEIVKVRINPEKSPADRALADRYGVKGYPSVFVSPAPGAPAAAVASFTRTGKEDIEVSAERFLKSIEGVGPEQAQTLIHEGSTKSQRGDLAGAKQDLDRAIELDPRNGLAHYWRGRVAAQAGEPGAAVGYFKQAAALDPKNAFAHAELGGLYARNGQWDQAIAAFSDLIAVDPGWQGGAAFGMRGSAYRQSGNHQSAATDHAEACRRGHRRSCTP